MTEFDMSDPRNRAAARKVFDDLEGFMDRGEATESHSILVCDPSTGRRHIVGPYPDRAAAEADLPRLREGYIKADPEFINLQYEVVITFDPKEC